MKTVLIYVLSSQFPPYDALMNASMDTWDSEPWNYTETTFYVGNKGSIDRPNILSLPLPEEFNNVPARNFAAFQYALKNKEFDYMARVNASCYVRKAKLLEAVQDLPDTNVFRGVACEDKFMWGGAQFILSRDVVQRMVDNPDKWDHSLMDDLSLSKLARDLGIPWDTKGSACSVNKQDHGWLCIWYENGFQGGFTFKTLVDMMELKKQNQYFIRVKQDGARDQDVRIMHALHEAGL